MHVTRAPRRRRLTAAAALVAGALALAGCSSSGTDDAPDGSGTSAAPVELAGTGWQAAERDAVQDGGTLQLPVDSAPANWNLYNTDAGTVDDNLITSLYVPSFIQVDDQGQWSAEPDYVDRIEQTSESPQVIEIDIAQAATWSDGTPITAADVIGTWTALNGTNPDYAPTATNVWEDISSVQQGATEKNVTVTFGTVNVDWPSAFGAIYPTWLTASPEAFNTAWASGPFAADGTTYVSGGPFVVQSFDQTGGVITFGRNPAWWGDTPKLETVIFKPVSRDATAQAFANGEIDAFNLQGSADNLATVESTPDATVLRSLGTTYRHITLNGTSEVFSDVRVRQAFATALNRELLGQAILSPVGSPAETLGNLIYLPGQAGYEDHATQLDGDAQAARSLLEEAGATFSGNTATLDGQPLTVRFVIPSDNPNSANVAQLVTQQVAAAGFTVNIETVPSADFFVSYISTEDRNFDATYFAWQGTPYPVSSTQSIYYPADSGQNFPGVTDESLGADFEAANAEFDPQQRIELANAIDEKLIGLYSTIPLFPEPFAYGADGNLANYGPAQFETLRWQDVGFTS